MRVVGTLTTMPDRYFKLPQILQYLRSQTYPLDAIYVGIPHISRRLGIPYPDIPEEITNLCTVVRCLDYGPMTKILGALLSETDPNTVLISFDDDMVYPPDLVEQLLNKHSHYPNSALGSAGMLLRNTCPMCAITPNENFFPYHISKFAIPPEGRRVDSIYGYAGALYVRKFFPSIDRLEDELLSYALINHDMYMNDDITISGYLSKKGIERRIFAGLPEVGFIVPEGQKERIRSEHEISYDLPTFFHRMNSAINTAKEHGMYEITEPLDISESIFGITFVVIVAVILVILFVLLAIMLRHEDYFIFT